MHEKNTHWFRLVLNLRPLSSSPAHYPEKTRHHSQQDDKMKMTAGGRRDLPIMKMYFYS
jgi:hypothetical protein